MKRGQDPPTTQVTREFVVLRPGSAEEVRGLIAKLRAVPDCRRMAQRWEGVFARLRAEDNGEVAP